MTILGRSLFKLALGLSFTFGGFLAVMWLSLEYNRLFIVFIVPIVIFGTYYLSTLECPKCHAPMFVRYF
jgi:hypothetical protein